MEEKLRMTPEEKNIYETVVVIDKDDIYKRYGCPSITEGFALFERLRKQWKLKANKDIFLVGS